MSVRCAFPETFTSPAEYDYTSPSECIVCRREHDLDDDTGRRIIEGDPLDGLPICNECFLGCADCGESVLEDDGSGMVVKEGAIWYKDKPYCATCFARALTGAEL